MERLVGNAEVRVLGASRQKISTTEEGNMFDYNVELAIKELFLFRYVLDDAVDAEDLWDILCDIYCVGDGDREELCGLLNADRLVKIRTLSDFYKAMRIKQYMDSFGGGYAVRDEREEELISIKGAVFESAHKNKLLSGYEKSSGVAYDELVSLSLGGVVIARRLLGIMQAEGIYITRDMTTAIENLRSVAEWSDIPALAAMVYYCPDARQEYLDRLYTVTEKTDYAVIVEQLQLEYGIAECSASETAKLLEKVFSVDGAKRDLCSEQILRVLRSDTLSQKDKRTALLGGNKQLLTAVCGLPLRLPRGAIETAPPPAPVLGRADERDAVMRALAANGMRKADHYLCPCVCAGSEYVRGAYVDLIRDAFPNADVAVIDVASLLPVDIDAQENDIFVRSCRENRANVFIIEMSGKIDERAVGFARMFACGARRRAYAIPRLGISLDLSAVLPVFVCDRKNAQLLDGAINVIKVADVADGERDALISDFIAKKKAQYDISDVLLTDEARAALFEMPTDRLCYALDRAMISLCQTGEGSISITPDAILSYASGSENGYGFGGKNNARK